MARIDVTALLQDPDFLNSVTLIRRASSVNSYGEHVMAETPTTLLAVVDTGEAEVLERMPAGARLSDIISVYYKGELRAESPGGYADVIVWNGRRYQVHEVSENYMNFGAGFTRADCLLEPTNV